MTASVVPLLHRLAAGDRAAVRETATRFGGLLAFLVRRYARPWEAEDAAQDVLFALWKNAARYDPKVATEDSFVAAVARNRLIDRARKEGRQPSWEPFAREPSDARSFDSLERAAELAWTERVATRLRPIERSVLLGAFGQDMSCSELARAHALPIGTVKSHARRGLKQVRAWLHEEKPREGCARDRAPRPSERQNPDTFTPV